VFALLMSACDFNQLNGRDGAVARKQGLGPLFHRWAMSVLSHLVAQLCWPALSHLSRSQAFSWTGVRCTSLALGTVTKAIATVLAAISILDWRIAPHEVLQSSGIELCPRTDMPNDKLFCRYLWSAWHCLL
jgi:hypothetical protein